MKRKFHVRCEAGENLEITSKSYLSLSFDIEDYVKHLHRMKVTPDTEVDDAFDCGEVEGDTTK